MSSSAVKLFIFISCFLVSVRIISAAKSIGRKLEKTSEEEFPLDMALNSVDDQFIGCEDDAEDKVVNTILEQELNSNPEFKRTWEENSRSDNYYDRISIKVYTAKTNIYKNLGDEMMNGRNQYIDGFHFKALHFFLTRAIQKRKPQECKTVYRRTNSNFTQNVKNREIRFGRFTSTSLDYNLIKFGEKSCFQIRTCYGADISNLSVFKNQKEVLIPPYEKFKVTDIQKKDNKMKCEILYILNSTGICSNMNCEMVNGSVSQMKC